MTVLLLKEGDQWVAQCLEHDIAAQGKEIDDALTAFAVIWRAQLLEDVNDGREPFSTSGPAPEHYFILARRAKRVQTRVPQLSLDVPVFEVLVV